MPLITPAAVTGIHSICTAQIVRPGAPKIWPEGNLALNNRNEPQPQAARRGNVEDGFKASDHVFEDRYSTTFVQNSNATANTPINIIPPDGRKLAMKALFDQLLASTTPDRT